MRGGPQDRSGQWVRTEAVGVPNRTTYKAGCLRPAPWAAEDDGCLVREGPEGGTEGSPVWKEGRQEMWLKGGEFPAQTPGLTKEKDGESDHVNKKVSKCQTQKTETNTYKSPLAGRKVIG